jgi:hypothetical protein
MTSRTTTRASNLPAVVADLCSDHPVRDPAYVLDLITQLPDDSAFAASVQGGREFRGWGFDRHVNVAVLDALQALAYILRAVNGDKKAKPPDPFPRPGARKQRRRPGPWRT